MADFPALAQAISDGDNKRAAELVEKHGKLPMSIQP